MKKISLVTLLSIALLWIGGCYNQETKKIDDVTSIDKHNSLAEKHEKGDFALNESCKNCHQNIFDEYSSSMHANSSIFKDPVHKAIWDKHPKNKKFKQYVCAKCHTPAADNFKQLITQGENQIPDANNPTHLEGVSCAYCHRIESIKNGKKSNTNVIAPNKKEYYGNIADHLDAGFHLIKTDNELFKNGNVCIGCHSHKENKHGLQVCTTEINNTEEQNCITCHMPEIEGNVSSEGKHKKHHFHGFPGTHSNQEMLAQYIDMDLQVKDNKIEVILTNNASHALLLHPLRLGLLKVKITHTDESTTEMEPVKFVRMLGKDGKPAPPWIADTELKNTVLQGNETKAFSFEYKHNRGDEITATLGYFLVNPKMVEKLGLQDDENIKRFYVLKTSTVKP